MPKRTEGLGADSKVPLRGFIDLFKELDASTKNTLRSAFVDAEDLQNYFNRSVPERQTKRKISGRIDTITLSSESTLLGGFLKWNRLNDRRIAFYEVQISDNTVFSSYETYTILETFLTLENLTTTKFARVRGVTAAGLTGLFSNTATIRPRISAPSVHSLSFYQRYGNDAEPSISRKLRYSGDAFSSDPHPRFYNVLSDDFYIDRLVGGAYVWGSISSRLKNYRDSGSVPWDRVRFKLNGISRSDVYSPHWTINYNNIDFNKNESNSGSAMTFYGRGGYTSSFGPYAISLPNTIGGEGANDAHSAVQKDTLDGAFYWFNPRNALRASRFDESQCERYNDTLPRHEASAIGIIEGGITDYIIFRDFRFNIPSTDTIRGIQLDLKRRQPNIFNDDIGANFGVKRPDRALGHDLVQEYKVGLTQLQRSHIVKEVTFGKYLDFTCFITGTSAFTAGLMRNDVDGISNNGVVTNTRTKLITGNTFTISSFFRVPTPVSAYTTALSNPNNFICFLDGENTCDLRMVVNLDRVNNRISNYIVLMQSSGRSYNIQHNVTATDSRSSVNVFHHFACTYDATQTSTGKLIIYIDGIAVNAPSIETTNFTLADRNKFTGNTNFGFSIGTPLTTTSFTLLSMSQIGIWDGKLTGATGAIVNSEMYELYLAKGFADYRHNFGNYQSANRLNHYFLTFPEQADVRDYEIRLTDNTGIRTDIDNKAITDETWPQLGHFFYTDLRQYGFLPIALSQDGIPHDNHSAIGYQEYGGELDKWGGTWTPEKINDFYFGCAIRATNKISLGYRANAYIDHAKMTVYTVPQFDRKVNVSVDVAVANEFYTEREIFGGICNIIETGELFNHA